MAFALILVLLGIERWGQSRRQTGGASRGLTGVPVKAGRHLVMVLAVTMLQMPGLSSCWGLAVFCLAECCHCRPRLRPRTG